MLKPRTLSMFGIGIETKSSFSRFQIDFIQLNDFCNYYLIFITSITHLAFVENTGIDLNRCYFDSRYLNVLQVLIGNRA